MEAGVEIDELLVHLIELVTEVGRELLEELLHDGGGGGHGCQKDRIGLRIPV